MRELFRIALLSFLALVWLSLSIVVIGQDARLIDSVGPAAECDLRGRFDLLLAETINAPDSRAIVYIHGTPAQISTRTKYLNEQLRFRQGPLDRITFITGRNIGSARTDMWLVPKGAEPPEIKPEALIAAEVGRAYKHQMDKAYDGFFTELKNQPDNYVSYIINYGTPAQIALREQWLREALKRTFGYHYPRMTFVNGGPGPVRTVMWPVPPGAENPTP